MNECIPFSKENAMQAVNDHRTIKEKYDKDVIYTYYYIKISFTVAFEKKRHVSRE
jgi:hypothetical protein